MILRITNMMVLWQAKYAEFSDEVFRMSSTDHFGLAWILFYVYLYYKSGAQGPVSTLEEVLTQGTDTLEQLQERLNQVISNWICLFNN